MSLESTTAIANPNIAFIKYWGNRTSELNIPANGSISMNLEGLYTRTKVTLDERFSDDRLKLNSEEQTGIPLLRVKIILDAVRTMAGKEVFTLVESENNFPTGAGVASSASAFAALSLASSKAFCLNLSEIELSRLARLGSGSASRSVPSGFVEWIPGDDDLSSYAYSIAPPEHWNLVDIIAVVSKEHKGMTSQDGHMLANTSPIQAARISSAEHRLQLCRKAILERDFSLLAEISELDSNLMHAVMMTSKPALYYWQPVTLHLMQKVVQWRKSGIPVFFTVDAGPNVHVFTLPDWRDKVKHLLQDIPEISSLMEATPGGPARLL